jgi:hypothetical protein
LDEEALLLKPLWKFGDNESEDKESEGVSADVGHCLQGDKEEEGAD